MSFNNKDYTFCYYIGLPACSTGNVETYRTWKRQLKTGVGK